MTLSAFELKKEAMALQLKELWQSLILSYTPTMFRFSVWIHEYSWAVCLTAIKLVPKQLQRQPNMTPDQILTYAETLMKRYSKKETE